MHQLHGILFAYRSNPALGELTRPRNTCSVPYGGRYRVIDFMLSNLINAGVTDIGLIVHEGYQSLLDHVGSGKDWDLSRKHGGLRILPPFGYGCDTDDPNYRGRMEALYRVRTYLQRIRQDYVVLAGGDLAVNLPLDDVMEAHLASGADITAICAETPQSDPRSSLYVSLDTAGRIAEVSISPSTPHGFESLEIYLLSRDLLLQLVDHCATHNLTSFGRDVLGGMSHTLHIRPYMFSGYFARIQSVESYFSHSMELLDSHVRAQLFAPDRAIRTKDTSRPSTYYGPSAHSMHCLVADNCAIQGNIDHSILFRDVTVEEGAKVSNCILMQGTVVGRGTVLHHVIADKNVRIAADRMLMGHPSYPLTLARDAVV